MICIARPIYSKTLNFPISRLLWEVFEYDNILCFPSNSFAEFCGMLLIYNFYVFLFLSFICQCWKHVLKEVKFWHKSCRNCTCLISCIVSFNKNVKLCPFFNNKTIEVYIAYFVSYYHVVFIKSWFRSLTAQLSDSSRFLFLNSLIAFQGGYGTEKPIVVDFFLHNHPALLMTRYYPEYQKFYFGLNYFNSFTPIYLFISYASIC